MLQRSTTVALLACASAATAQTQLRITEVLVDPIGSNAGQQVVEIPNDWNGPIDLTGWHVAGAGAVVALPSIVLPGGQIARLHLGVAGTSNAADVFVPALPTLSGSDTFTLLSSANVNDPSASSTSSAGGRGPT